MTASDDRERVFDARLGLGLRELDGREPAPDVRAAVLERLEAPATPRARWHALPWLVALLAVALVATTAWWSRSDRQAPTVVAAPPQDPAGPWRLVYRLDLTADADDEQLQATAAIVQQRLGAQATVRAEQEGTIVVTFADAKGGEVDAVRALIEDPGRFEMRLVATQGRGAKDGRYDLAAERTRLQAWLADGGRERLARDPHAIAQHTTTSQELRWCVHRILPRHDQPERFDIGYHAIQAYADCTIAAFAAEDWNDGKVPDRLQALPPADRGLVELVAIDLREPHFDASDLDPGSIRFVGSDTANPAFVYAIRPARAAAYGDFTAAHVDEFCALLWNDEVTQIPRFLTRLPGSGRIEGISPEQMRLQTRILTTPLPARPQLMKSEPATRR